MDQELLDLISKQLNEELRIEGHDETQRSLIWISIVKLIHIMDSIQAPIHNPLFVASLRSLARALELINSLRGTNGPKKST